MLELADVFRQYGEAFLKRWGHTVSSQQRKALRDIGACPIYGRLSKPSKKAWLQEPANSIRVNNRIGNFAGRKKSIKRRPKAPLIYGRKNSGKCTTTGGVLMDSMTSRELLEELSEILRKRFGNFSRRRVCR
jgi:hypothetical protein